MTVGEATLASIAAWLAWVTALPILIPCTHVPGWLFSRWARVDGRDGDGHDGKPILFGGLAQRLFWLSDGFSIAEWIARKGCGVRGLLSKLALRVGGLIPKFIAVFVPRASPRRWVMTRRPCDHAIEHNQPFSGNLADKWVATYNGSTNDVKRYSRKNPLVNKVACLQC